MHVEFTRKQVNNQKHFKITKLQTWHWLIEYISYFIKDTKELVRRLCLVFIIQYSLSTFQRRK